MSELALQVPASASPLQSYETVPSDPVRARHESAHAVVAFKLGWGLGVVSILPRGRSAGRCTSSPPSGRDSHRVTLEEITIKLAGQPADNDLAEAEALAAAIATDPYERVLLLAWCKRRAESLLARPDARGAVERLAALLQRHGELDLRVPAAPSAEASPIRFELHAPMPPITIRNEFPERPKRSIQVRRDEDGNVLGFEEEQPQRLVVVRRDAEGNALSYEEE